MFRYQQNHQTPWTQHFAASGHWPTTFQDQSTGLHTVVQNQQFPGPDSQAIANHLQQADYHPVENFDSDSQINVELCDEDLWSNFSNVGTEMILTKTGRRIFPGYRVKFSGLDPNAIYCVMLDVISIDDNRYKFQNGDWNVTGRGEPQYQLEYYVHPNSPATGKSIMNNIISFHKVKLTNSLANRTKGKFILHSLHRYQLRVHIVRSDNVQNAHMQRMRTFQFPQTTFITVTAYQNSELSQLKIANNPFARGFRPDGARGKKKFQHCHDHVIEYEVTKRARKTRTSSVKSVEDILLPQLRANQETFEEAISAAHPKFADHRNSIVSFVQPTSEQYQPPVNVNGTCYTTVNNEQIARDTTGFVNDQYASPTHSYYSQQQVPYFTDVNYQNVQSSYCGNQENVYCKLNEVPVNSKPAESCYTAVTTSPSFTISQTSDTKTYHSLQCVENMPSGLLQQSVECIQHCQPISPTSDDTGYISTSPAEFLSNDDVTKFLFEAQF